MGQCFTTIYNYNLNLFNVYSCSAKLSSVETWMLYYKRINLEITQKDYLLTFLLILFYKSLKGKEELYNFTNLKMIFLTVLCFLIFEVDAWIITFLNCSKDKF